MSSTPRSRRRIWTTIYVLIWIAVVAPAALGQTLERIAASKTLRIGFIDDQAPFSAKTASGTAEGYAIDLCKVVAQEIGRHVEGLSTVYNEIGLGDAFQVIADGRIDLLCGAVTATLHRRETVDFSQPFFITGASALLRKDGPRTLHDFAFGDSPLRATRSIELTPFETIRVGVRQGTRTEALLTEAIAKGGYKAMTIGFPTHADGLAALEAASIDAYFADRGLLTAMLEKAHDAGLELGSRMFSREPYAIAMRRGDSGLRLLVDRTLTEFFQTTQFPAVLSRYFGDQADAIAAQLRDLSLPE